MDEEELRKLSIELNRKIVEVAKGYPAECMLDSAIGFLSAYAALDETVYEHVLNRIRACAQRMRQEKEKALFRLDSDELLDLILRTYGKR